MNKPSTFLITVCLLGLYLLWGSTFIAIRVSVETIPPYLVGGFRYLLGAILLFPFLVGRKTEFVRSEILNALLVGSITAGVANGALILSEKTVPSSVAAVAFTLMPIFMLLVNWIAFEKIRPTLLDKVAMAMGVSGNVLLFGGATTLAGAQFGVSEILLMISSPLFWAFGALVGRKSTLPRSWILNSAFQMLGGCILFFVLGVVSGDFFSVLSTQYSTESIYGVLYLAVFGSFVGYSLFAFLIRAIDSRIVSTYAFVNPVVALWLGHLWGERLVSIEAVVGAVLALLGVGTIIGEKVYLRFRQKK